MSYISAIRKRDEVLVWERNNGERQLKRFPAPFYFYTKDPDGEYTSLYGDRLTRHDFVSGNEMSAAKGQAQGQRLDLFESDIPPELKVLSQQYYGVEAPTLHVTFLDIEVDYKPEIGFSSVKNPYAEINSVALHHRWLNKHILLIVPPPSYDGTMDPEEFKQTLNDIEPLPDGEVEVVFCENEVDLLFHLLVEIEDSDVMCGWNSDFFDIPYIGKRLQIALGEKYFRMLSFPEASAPRWKTIEKFNVEQLLLEVEGRISVDYLELYKKYEVSDKPSYKLDTISEDVLPDMRKLEYEGSLANLYTNNFPHFVRYNLRDTEILNGFEDKLGYVQLANEMYHISTGLMKHVTGTIKLAELATINFCHYERGVQVPDIDVVDSDSIQGAYVLLPTVGMHEWIGSMDINSLYPSAIRSINISPETIIGQFDDNIRAWEEIVKQSLVSLSLTYDSGEVETNTADEWYAILKERKWAISGYGTIFDQAEKGIVPSILEDWYTRRKQFQKLAKTTDNKDEAAYYDRIQFVYKIKLNSFYGALTNDYFRFNDYRAGESTTGTGRAILRHMCAQVCKELDGEYTLPNREEEIRKGKVEVGYTDDRSVVYGDTDSTYFLTHGKTKQEAILIADAVAKKVTNTFQQFMRDTFLCTPEFDDIIKAGREIVSSRGLFVDKKRYVLHIVDDEGKEVDKLKVMGLDTKKTTLPKQVSDKLNKFVERLLKGETWDSIAEDIVAYKEELKNTDDIMSIGLPKGIKGIEEYTENLRIYGDGQRLPGHVAAAIHYNQCIERFEDKESIQISTGMKIKVYYLTKKYGRFKSIALPTDATIVPDWFKEHFTVDRDLHIERLVDNPLRNMVKAVGYDIPSKQTLLVDSLLDF